jgi:Uma2 family endonuclease
MCAVRTGQIMAESGIRTEREPDTVRGPDISYMSNARFAEAGKATACPDVAPELCVEVASPTDSWPKLREKADEYLAAGVLVVWIVDAERKQVHVFTKSGEPVVLADTDTLRGGEVLVGFELPLAELFTVLDVN